MSRFRYVLFAFSLMFLFSCEKEELSVLPYDRGDVVNTSLTIGSDYRYQLFFDLETNTVVGQNNYTEWDLAFESTPDGFHVFLNYADLMSVKNTFETDFSTSYSYDIPGGLIPISHIDSPSGNVDSTAIGDWRGKQEVYLINRGYGPSGSVLGNKKIVFLDVNENEYAIKFADLDGNNEITMTVPKKEDYNFTFLSFNNGGAIVDVEPPKEDWDISFTRFTETLDSGIDSIVYGVTSVLSNRYNVEVARDFETAFENIKIENIENYSFSTAINAIGHDWKYFSFDEGFLTNPNMNFIIKSTEDKYYKLHFLDFYDENGNKGTPLFEFQEL